MQINVFLVDVLETTKVGDCRSTMVKRVSELYKDCLDFAGKRTNPPSSHTVDVKVMEGKPSPADTDMIVYLLPATLYSLVDFSETKSKTSYLAMDHWGRTFVHPSAPGSPTAGLSKSEVSCKSLNGCDLGSVVFHEILHAKTFKSDAQLHPTTGLGARSVNCASKLNGTNRQDIANTLTRKITQWTEGWEIMNRLKLARDSKDPLWDH